MLDTLRLYLINPKYPHPHYAAMANVAELMGKKKMSPPHQLALLAALAPANYEVTIIDEDVGPLPFEPLPHLVGITALSVTSDRAIAIARAYRQRGVPVVLGGPFATCQREEARAGGDYLIIGEAENSWSTFLRDFAQGRAKEVYRSDAPCSLETSPPPRWDLIQADDYLSVTVETSRGCPFSCRFCLAHHLFGRRMRFRAVDDVIREIETAPLKHIFFVSDNFAFDRDYAWELVQRLRPLRRAWVCQTSLHIGDDEALLAAMAQAGCSHILVGFEALNDRSLAAAGKSHHRGRDYGQLVRRIHRQGMHVLASFLVGFDTDSLDAFDAIARFAQEHNIVYPLVNTLTVAPGTALYDEWRRQGRMTPFVPSFLNGMFPCAHYAQATQREMWQAYLTTVRRLYSWQRLHETAVPLFQSGQFARPGPDTMAWPNKARAMINVGRSYTLSRNPWKRRLFLELTRLVAQRRLAPDKMAIFLLHMEGFQRFFQALERKADWLEHQLDRHDRQRPAYLDGQLYVEEPPRPR
jgi:pyruvate-formate lyase-activating enzyme